LGRDRWVGHAIYKALTGIYSTSGLYLAQTRPYACPTMVGGLGKNAQVRSLRRSFGFERAGGFYGQRLVEIIDDAGSRDFITLFEIAGFEVFDKGLGADIGLDILIGNALFFQALPHHNHDMADMRIPGFFDIDKPQGDEQNTE